MAARVKDGYYRCPQCKEAKARSDFYETKTKSTGVSHYCKSCQCERQREARQRQAELTYD